MELRRYVAFMVEQSGNSVAGFAIPLWASWIGRMPPPRLSGDEKLRHVLPAPSPLLIRMHPEIRRDLARLRQLDHVHRRRVAALAAGSAFQRRFQLPDRRIPRPADGIERKARAGLAAVALDLKPGEPAIEALPDRRRRLRRAAVALHADRPRFGLGAVGLANGLFGGFLGALGADFRAPDPAAPDDLSRFGAHGGALQRSLRARAMPLGLEAGNVPATPRLRQSAIYIRSPRIRLRCQRSFE